MGGQTPPEDGDDQSDDDGNRRERRQLIRQLLIDWSPVLATVASRVFKHFS